MKRFWNVSHLLDDIAAATTARDTRACTLWSSFVLYLTSYHRDWDLSSGTRYADGLGCTSQRGAIANAQVSWETKQRVGGIGCAVSGRLSAERCSRSCLAACIPSVRDEALLERFLFVKRGGVLRYALRARQMKRFWNVSHLLDEYPLVFLVALSISQRLRQLVIPERARSGALSSCT
jgi:hypothetical protein